MRGVDPDWQTPARGHYSLLVFVVTWEANVGQGWLGLFIIVSIISIIISMCYMCYYH